MKHYIKKSELGYFHVCSDDGTGHPNRVRCETYDIARKALKALRAHEDNLTFHWYTADTWTTDWGVTTNTVTLRYTTTITPI